MTGANGRAFLAAAGALVCASGLTYAQGGAGVVWRGQTGEDRVGPSSKVGPSGVQDLVFEIRGLPRGIEIRTIEVRGQGGDEWRYKGPYGPWAAEVERPAGGDRALIFVEPGRVETGRTFDFKVVLENGKSADFSTRGGQADPSRRAAGQEMRATWIGYDGSDRTGPGPAVGPDGFQDVHLALDRLTPGIRVRSVAIEGAQGEVWCAGLNPGGKPNAEFLADGESEGRGHLYFSPSGEIPARKTYRLRVEYVNGTKDGCELTSPGAGMPPVTAGPAWPRVVTLDVKGRWARNALAIDGLRSDVAAAVVTDDWGNRWDAPGNASLTREASGRVVIGFPDRKGPGVGDVWVRLVAPDGSMGLATLTKDETREADAFPSAGGSVVRSSEELTRVVAAGGTVRLAAMKYVLHAPLVAARSVSLIGSRGTVLEFRQGEGEAPWATAIRLEGDGTSRLEGFAIRFGGPVRWDWDHPFGPSVIGTGKPASGGDPLIDRVEVVGLDVEVPPATTSWEESPDLLRVMDADEGLVQGSRLSGGAIEFARGPWRIEKNRFEGPGKGQFAYSAMTGHQTRRLEVRENVVEPARSDAKIWRFLVLTVWSSGAKVQGNKIAGVGPRDDDAREHPNAPEVILTEGYRIRYEGKVAGVANGGELLGIYEPQGEPVRVGDVASIVSGKGAGTWSRVVDVLNPRVFRLERPIGAEGGVVSITPGFVNQEYEGNTIDCMGSKVAVPFVLAGCHFGTKVVGNTIRGGGNSLRLTAFPSEEPVHWGWSFTPTFGAEVSRNRVDDSAMGGYLGVERTTESKSTGGRVYFTAKLEGNVVAWTDRPAEGPRVAWTIGQAGVGEPGESVLSMAGSTVEAPAGTKLGPTLSIERGTVNGKAYEGARIELQQAAPGANTTSRP